MHNLKEAGLFFNSHGKNCPGVMASHGFSLFVITREALHQAGSLAAVAYLTYDATYNIISRNKTGMINTEIPTLLGNHSFNLLKFRCS